MARGAAVRTNARSRTLLAWSLWLLAFGCCVAGLVVTLAVTRPLTIAVLAEGAARALAYPLGYATIGLVLSLRRPANPIGWLYATAGLAWSLSIPVDPWLSRLVGEHRPLPLAAQAAAVYGELNWAPATVLGGHPAGAAGTRWAAALTPVAAGGGRRRGRGRPGAGGRRPGPGAAGGPPDRQPVRAGRACWHRRQHDGRRRHDPLGGQHGGVGGLRGAAVPGRPWGRAPAAALGRRRRRRCGGRAAGRGGHTPEQCDLVHPVLHGAVYPDGGGGGGAALPAVGPGPAGLPHRHLRRRHRAAGAALPADPPRRHPPGRRRRRPGGGRHHPGGGGRVRAAAPPGPGRGGPALQPPPLRRRPHRGGVRGPAARAGRPGRAQLRAAGGGRPDGAADPGVAVAAPAGQPAVVAAHHSTSFQISGCRRSGAPTSVKIVTACLRCPMASSGRPIAWSRSARLLCRAACRCRSPCEVHSARAVSASSRARSSSPAARCAKARLFSAATRELGSARRSARARLRSRWRRAPAWSPRCPVRTPRMLCAWASALVSSAASASASARSASSTAWRWSPRRWAVRLQSAYSRALRASSWDAARAASKWLAAACQSPRRSCTPPSLCSRPGRA